MFYEQRMAVPDSPERLREEYETAFKQLVEDIGLETAAERTSIEVDRLEALGTDDSPSLSLEEAARIQALGEDEPDPETIETMACEHLLLGMSTAVLDVDAVESHLEIDLDPKEIQQKIERRATMSFEEYVHLQYTIVDETP